MGTITVEGNRLRFEKRDEITVIEPYGENCLRVRSTRTAEVSDERWTLLEPRPGATVTITEGEGCATIECGNLRATIQCGMPWDDGKITFFRKGKQILRSRFEGDSVLRFKHLGGDSYEVKAIFDANPGEHFYGLGQETEFAFDRKGSTCNIIHYNTKSTIPVYYSSLGYGFLWNNPSPGRCELTNNHTLFCSENAYQVDYLVFVGDAPADVMSRYCDLTGYPPKFPDWASGFWQSKLRYESQEDVLSVAREYRRRGIPIAAIVIDFFHWTEQGDWKFDPKYWPDPRAMCDELRALGIEPVVSVWPTINPKSENYREMNDGNLLIRTENGQFGMFDFYGQQAFIDPTNPKTGPFVWSRIKRNYYDYGIKAFWLDEAEPEVHPQQFGNLRLYAGNGARAALLYPYYYSKLFWDGLSSEGETEIALLTRAAYPGSQKFGAIVWNGDIVSTFEALRKSVSSGLSMAMSGIPWWNSDIGGFCGGDTESDYFRELIVRWFQFGLFCPVMRLHGARQRTANQVDRHPGIIERSGGDNEIWSFGDRDYPILKRLIEIRERMRPYIARHMKIASETGAPLLRPMFFDYHEDDRCYALDDQYMFGEDILFAPILDQGQTSRSVYLPEGEWINAIDDQCHVGKRDVNVTAELDQFIAFVKKGSAAIEFFR
jgi:alpha-D-xyloside xylohydrolase